MSKYTTQVRYICETLSGETDINSAISKSVPIIFNYDYGLLADFRSVFEPSFLRHYWVREIGCETYALWQLQLLDRLSILAPKYNRLWELANIDYNVLDTHTLTSSDNTLSNQLTSNVLDTVNSNKTNVTSQTNSNQDTNNNELSKFSDTPQSTVDNLLSGKYLTNATSKDNNSTSTNYSDTKTNTDSNGKITTNNNTSDTTNTQKNTLVCGRYGTAPSDLISKATNAIITPVSQLINELETLFINIY